MATDIAFNFVRRIKVVEIGECIVTVEDPTNDEEIAAKLKKKDFKRYLVRDKEEASEEMEYTP